MVRSDRTSAGRAPSRLWYLDASAAAKLVVAEPESDALRAWCADLVGRHERAVVSDLTRAEVLRVARRSPDDLLSPAHRILTEFEIVGVPAEAFDRAATIHPPTLRTLDALHLAAALQLGAALAGVVTYDQRLADAADLQGMARTAPGRDR